MGNCCGQEQPSNKPDKKPEKKPEKEPHERDPKVTNPQNNDNIVDLKILLLGSGDSGKSTLFKQIKITETGGFTNQEVLRYQSTIYGNLIHTIDSLVDLLKEKESIPRLLPQNNERVFRLKEVTKEEAYMWDATRHYTEEMANDIQELSNDSDITNAFNNMRYEAHVFEGATYFFKDLERLRPPHYLPNDTDILYCRQKTTGISDVTFEFKTKRLKVVDVGGQRPERRKWINAYDEVDAIIFVASLSDFDQKCYEDDLTNRMQESIDLFSRTINDERFKDTPIILLLNKTDVFTRKLQQKSIRTLFGDEYTGPDKFEESVKFIENKYLSTNQFDPNRIFTFWSCATQTDDIKEVFGQVKKRLLEAKFPDLRENPSNE